MRAVHTFFSVPLLCKRFAYALFLALSVFMFTAAPSQAASKRVYAGIVIDAKTGKTLYAHAADSIRYPASVTKVMTLYIVFQELEAGRLKLSTRMRVSKHAANAVPTKLGLRAGKTIKVEDAIKSLVTLSANDISRVIAEHISGTESKFAKRMTKTARALGMKRTTYRNASGLPNSKQVTTARDQARLGVAVYQHFPKYYKYFQTRGFKYGKRTYGNHNRLLGKNGVDGIKTGYIRAAGYNLLTAARKNNRHIVVVGFGFNSGGKRNAKVAQLVSRYLPKARRGSYTAQSKIAKPGRRGASVQVAAVPVTPRPRLAGRIPAPQVVAVAPAPAPKQVMVAALTPTTRTTPQTAPAPQLRPVNLVPTNAVAATQLIVAPTPKAKPNNIVGAWIQEKLSIGPQTNTNGVMLPPAPIGNAPEPRSSGPIDLITSGSVAAKPTTAWVVQVGAAYNADSAHHLLGTATQKIAELKNFRAFVEPFSKNGQTFHRARFTGFGDSDQARNICAKLTKKNMSCLAMPG